MWWKKVVFISLSLWGLSSLADHSYGVLKSGFCSSDVREECKYDSLQVSVLSQDEVKSLFREMKERADLALGYKLDGCYARADKLARFAESKGIIVAKGYIHGVLRPVTEVPQKVSFFNLKNEDGTDFWWGYHVFAVVLVKDDRGENVPMVLDPSVITAPRSLSDYKKRMLGPGDPETRVTEFYYGSRFQYFSRHTDAIAAASWNDENLDHAAKTLSKYQKFVDGAKVDAHVDSILNDQKASASGQGTR